jgi:uncharacterized protein (DUF305 family)
MNPPIDAPVRTADRRLVFVLAAALLALGAALAVVSWRSARPDDDSPEAGFARDMATHHAQAVEMALVVRDRSADERLRSLTYDIIVTQNAQRGMFMGWLQQWGLPQSSAMRMSWMPGHLHGAPGSSGTAAGTLAAMPGMASDEELGSLRAAEGREAEVLFLQLMIRHHEGGVLMARAISDLSGRDEVVSMARAIEDTQAGEIALMTEMLAERGGQRLPTILH